MLLKSLHRMMTVTLTCRAGSENWGPKPCRLELGTALSAVDLRLHGLPERSSSDDDRSSRFATRSVELSLHSPVESFDVDFPS